MKISNSVKSFKEAEKLIPGGVNSPARAFKSVECNPIFISKAKGSKIYDDRSFGQDQNFFFSIF